MKKMHAINFYAPKNIKYETININDPKDGEVQVKIDTALTCGTDVKTYYRGHPVYAGASAAYDRHRAVYSPSGHPVPG